MIHRKIVVSEDISLAELYPANMDYPFFEKTRNIGFNCDTDKFSLSNAAFLSDAAFVAYNHPAFVKYVFYYAGLKNFNSFIGGKVAFSFAGIGESKKKGIAGKKKYLLVVFRGTELKNHRTISGVIADLRISLSKEEGGGLVHSGFRKVLDEIWDGEGMLREYIYNEKKKNPQLKIIFTGHSLGGALALIAASRFKDTDAVYTFGCPRVGNKIFTYSIAASVFRVINNNDAITALPPKKILSAVSGKQSETYEHKGSLKFIDAEGRILDKIQNKFSSDKKGEKTSFLALENNEVLDYLIKTRGEDFADHSPLFYTTKLWNAYVDSLEKK